MSCGEKRARRLVLASFLWGAGFALLYFSPNIYGIYNVPFLALLSTPLLLLGLLTRKMGAEKWLSASMLFASFAAATPVFYAASIIVTDSLRSGKEVSPFLSSIYQAFPDVFNYVLVAFFFSVFVASSILYKASEDFFERILRIERFKITSILSVKRFGPLELIGVAVGAVTALFSLWAGYKSLLFLPFLFYAKVQVLVAASLTVMLNLYAGLPVNVFAAAAAAATYYIVEGRLYSRYAGEAVRGVKRPMKMFLSAIALLIVLTVFFVLFQERAPLYASLYLIVVVPLLYATPLVEMGALSIPLLYVLLLGSSSLTSFSSLIGVRLNPNDVELLDFMVSAAILGAQFSPYSTFFTAREELEECHSGVYEGTAAVLAMIMATWYFAVNPPRPLRGAAAPPPPIVSVLLPLVALLGSLVHMVLATPLISEGAYVLAVNPVEPLGVLLGAIFPSQIFLAVLLSAIILKVVDIKSGRRVSGIMRGFIYGIGLGAVAYAVMVHGL